MATQRPQDLVFSLFGEYLLDRPGPIWVGDLIELLAPFGLSENAVRTALSRMARKGWLETERRGRRSFYDLSPRGRTLLEKGAERIHDPPRGERWDGGWTLVSYSIPEEDREARDRLRDRLLWLGCGSLGGGLWISPHDVEAPVVEAAEELGVDGFLEVFRGDHLGVSDPGALVAKCWDLEAIEVRYADFVGAHEPGYRASLAAAGRGELSPETAFVRRFELIHEYREFPLIDPFLPQALLPGRWSGHAAASLFDRYHELLTEPADRYVDSVLGEPVPVPA
ncbi:MAG: PaaX family transcriptional regulator C-terminal domain-containing protein [Gemmatimonadota bacterium]|nr:PaaX family transcriptional regulator C-terminal domain-containing protein [Gemmatimonadota bacterium]